MSYLKFHNLKLEMKLEKITETVSKKLKNNVKTIFMNYLKFYNSKQEMNKYSFTSFFNFLR